MLVGRCRPHSIWREASARDAVISFLSCNRRDPSLRSGSSLARNGAFFFKRNFFLGTCGVVFHMLFYRLWITHFQNAFSNDKKERFRKSFPAHKSGVVFSTHNL